MPANKASCGFIALLALFLQGLPQILCSPEQLRGAIWEGHTAVSASSAIFLGRMCKTKLRQLAAFLQNLCGHPALFKFHGCFRQGELPKFALNGGVHDFLGGPCFGTHAQEMMLGWALAEVFHPSEGPASQAHDWWQQHWAMNHHWAMRNTVGAQSWALSQGPQQPAADNE